MKKTKKKAEKIKSVRPTVDRTKLYEPTAAIKLAQATARNRFIGKIEAHISLRSKGKFGKWQSEKKAPLLHAVLGKQNDKPETLLAELKSMVKTVGSSQIVKLTLCATMGPGVKVDCTKFKK